MNRTKQTNLPLIILLVIASTSWLKAQDKDVPEFHFGGALRFNYNYSSWKDGHKKRGGDFGYDVLSLRPQASYKGIGVNADVRLYTDGFGGIILKQGWFDYDFTAQDQIQLGLTQVPFGITHYNSNSFFFSLNYYIGLEDDHDMGIKYQHKDDKWSYAIAFFKNAEELTFGSNSDASNSRYSYDVGSIDENGDGELQYRNKEVNQLNIHLNRQIKEGELIHNMGVSGEFGGLYNLDTEGMGSHFATAIHYETSYRKWKLKTQVSYYKNSPNTPEGERTDVVAMTAFGAPYLVAAEATTYTVGLSFTQAVDWGPISCLMFYNDFGYMDKAEDSFYDSYQNVTGCLVFAGPIYTYIDAALGKNQPWLGPDYNTALAYGSEGAEWHLRFNINFGYYF
ncbi:hypothetical protein [Sediminitomix flava]|uniref:Phosphate-selective porin O/P n=1 Tax=Sediminitomix flava TaxID=379075 RepID=A0A315ZBL6_SEDFL|nr:hypothetical protein [Sediminitomix flava]PWJ42463.1 hypothetical protein BC781_1024 [Sediminitomix flava]